MRAGTCSSLMTDAPRAASVGATIAPMSAATQSPLPPNRSAATAAPAAIVSGSPMHSSRRGWAAAVRSSRALTGEASGKEHQRKRDLGKGP